MPEALQGAKLKIERAKSHFIELQSRIHAFSSDEPYRLVEEDSFDGGEHRVKIVARNIKEVPLDISSIIGDVVHNLRVTLDFTVSDLARINGHTSRTAIRATYFPTGADRNRFEAEAADKIKKLSPAAKKFICRLQPYPGGKSQAIRQLHEIDIDDKHTTLVTTAALLVANRISIVGANIAGFQGWSPGSPNNFFVMGMGRLPSLHDGMAIMSFSPGINYSPRDVKINPAIDVVFGNGQVFADQSVLPTLQNLIDLVERIVHIAKKRFF